MLVGRRERYGWTRRYEKQKDAGSYEDFLADMAASVKIPLGRVGRAEEFANMACFLASDRGSYITGTAIHVDGGISPVVCPIPASSTWDAAGRGEAVPGPAAGGWTTNRQTVVWGRVGKVR